MQRVTGVQNVRHVANGFDSTADLYLEDDRLPDLEQWRKEFAQEHNGLLTLVSGGVRPPVLLAPIQGYDKVQWDFGTKQPRALLPAEESAYRELQEAVRQAQPKTAFTVTGPLRHDQSGFFQEVRAFV